MNEQIQTDTETKPKQTRGHKRSPYLFPAYDFGFAKQIAERVERDGAGSLSEETLAIALHLSVKSSGFQLKTLTARQFGLLTKQGSMLSTTPLAKAIFKPINETEKRSALINTFMTIPLFKEVATRFKGRPLPQSQDFRNLLERELGIDAKRVSDAERVLMDSAKMTGVLVDSGGSVYLSTETTTTPTQNAQQQAEGESADQPGRPENGKSSRPAISVQIESKDFVSMDPDKIAAFFDGLSKIIGKEEK